MATFDSHKETTIIKINRDRYHNHGRFIMRYITGTTRTIPQRVDIDNVIIVIDHKF